MRSALCFALTPALSQRERELVGSPLPMMLYRLACMNCLLALCESMYCSLSLWERAGVRAAACPRHNGASLTGAHP